MQGKIGKEPYRLPWESRLPRLKAASIKHPTSLSEFKKWPKLNDVARRHLMYLELCEEQLKSKWLGSWREVFATGPFLNREKGYASIPFIIVANYRRPFRHILKLSQILADAYLEFGILPDVHLLSTKTVQILNQTGNLQWIKTRKVSISLEK
jgi:hypothetical protein